MSDLLHAITYYQDHKDTLDSVVDELIERALPETDDIPAFTFAVLCEALGKDHTRAVTIAALAVMRLTQARVAELGLERDQWQGSES